MNFILPVLICLLVFVLVVFITSKMIGREVIALAAEKKPAPPRIGVFFAGLITVLSFMIAIVSALLIMFAPFLSISLGGTADNTQTVLFIACFGSIAFGSGAYWLFVKLGYFSWKVFSLD